MEINKKAYWDEFYRNHHLGDTPSPFAVFVINNFFGYKSVIDFGCGNGRDSIFFAKNNYRVVGIDYSQEAIVGCKSLSTNLGFDNTTIFERIDVKDQMKVENLLEKEVKCLKPTIFYGRFFLHAIDSMREQVFMEMIQSYLRNSDILCLEFRTTLDELRPKLFGSHSRRYIDAEAFINRWTQSRLCLDFYEEGDHLAIFEGEKAEVARVVLGVK
jgi:tellurite methyltransferase